MFNKITDNEIEEYIEDVYALGVEELGNSCILGVFITGKANTGFVETMDDLKATLVYLPKFEELCFSEPKESYISNVRVVDIRLIYHVGIKDNWDSLEMLFSSYYKINKRYEDTFMDTFMKNRELIGRYNPKVRMKRALNKARDAMLDEDYYELIRVFLASRYYCGGKNLMTCFTLPKKADKEMLENAANGNLDNDDYYYVGRIQDYYNKVEDEINYDADKAIKEGVVSLISIALKNEVEINAFYDSLNADERIALAAINRASKADSRGYFNVSAISKETSLSKRVFENLFKKLEAGQIARIKSHGRSGTEIEYLTDF